jgi:nucleoporin GLE1
MLCAQLPTPPSVSAPALLSQPPPTTYSYLLSHLSKALIKQAEAEVNAKPDAAFPLARIVLGLLLRGHAALGEVLFARMVKKCPWVVSHYPERSVSAEMLGFHPLTCQDQSREEYEKSTGRGLDESLAEYINRMSGILTLYFAILQTPLSSVVPTLPAHPSPVQLLALVDPALRLPAAWRWLAFALFGPLPALAPTAQFVVCWIDVVGAEVARVYGVGQVSKVFAAVAEAVEKGVVKGDSTATKERLKLGLGKAPKYMSGREWEV